MQTEHLLSLIRAQNPITIEDLTQNDYPYSTNIPRYNLLEGSVSDWSSLNGYFNKIQWRENLHITDINKQKLEENIDTFIKYLEHGVEDIFREKSEDKKFLKADSTTFRLKILFPEK